MSMSEEQLQKTGILKIMLNKVDNDDDDEMTLVEKTEMIEDKIDYLQISDKNKENLKDLVSKIKEENDSKVQEYLFRELLKIMNSEE